MILDEGKIKSIWIAEVQKMSKGCAGHIRVYYRKFYLLIFTQPVGYVDLNSLGNTIANSLNKYELNSIGNIEPIISLMAIANFSRKWFYSSGIFAYSKIL